MSPRGPVGQAAAAAGYTIILIMYPGPTSPPPAEGA